MRGAGRFAVMLFVAALAACSGGGGGGNTNTCTTQCPSVGATKCSGTQVQTCSAGSGGCLAWSAAASCTAGQICSSSANACVADVCGGIPPDGVCANSSTVQFCGAPSGDATPRLLSYSCVSGESCQVVAGKAKCVPTGACSGSATECADANNLRTCNAGTWQTSACANGCRTSTLGAFCAAPGTLTSFSGRVVFEAKVPNNGLTDWTTSPNQYYAPLFLVLSRGAGGVYDAVYTSAAAGSEGSFTIQVPQTPTADDRVIVAAAADDNAGGLAFAVASPGFSSTGEAEVGSVGTPALWSWAWQTGSLTNGQNLVITEAMGSGAANVYFNMVYAYAVTYSQYGQIGPSLITWLQNGVSWRCGACFAKYPTTAFGLPFATQAWIPADTTDQSYWSDAVNSHEFGHWAMSSFGVSPGEGGTHILGNPTYPGQAWSEGWATWFSAALRNDPVYYDKQGGAFFWVNIGTEGYSNGNGFVQPVAANGLLQRVDENEVSSMMWSLSNAGGASPLFQALRAPRMTSPTATRGYTRHTWQLSGLGLIRFGGQVRYATNLNRDALSNSAGLT